MFSFLRGKKKDEVNVKVVEEVVQAPVKREVISLEKSIISLDKTLINLSKTSGVDFEKHIAKVAVVMDYSGSMRRLYNEGDVQEVLTRLMPLALKFDDDGELDIWLFNGGHMRMECMDKGNYDNYVNNVIQKSGFRMGTTSYAPVLEDVMEYYFVEEKDTSNIPTFVIFITDGANDDRRNTNEVIKRSSQENIFVQFVGIGNEKFEYLEKLDDLTGRPVDNTGFIKVDDMHNLNDEELYSLLMEQYPEWLNEKGLK